MLFLTSLPKHFLETPEAPEANPYVPGAPLSDEIMCNQTEEYFYNYKNSDVYNALIASNESNPRDTYEDDVKDQAPARTCRPVTGRQGMGLNF